MEYAIFIIVALLVLWAYHRIIYMTVKPYSNYGKFEYYLNGEVNEPIGTIILITELFIVIALIVTSVYFGGQLIKLFL